MPHIPSPRALAGLVLSVLLAALLVGPSLAQGPDASPSADAGWGARDHDDARVLHGPRGPREPHGPRVVLGMQVLHGPVSITIADPTSDGHRPGDLRVTSVATTDAAGRPLGRLDATLITTAVDVPGPGDEIRISTLVFSFDEEGHSQVVVGGTAIYPAQGATLAAGAVTTRPIQGGSGRFAGASGWAVSEHLADGTWRHTLHLEPARPGMRHGIGGPGFGPAGPLHEVREALRQRVVERLRARARAALEGSDEAAGSEPGIVRTALGLARPGSAPGQDLGLWQYTIPAGSTLEPHRHPGWQIARIARGELAYTIISGEAEVLSADGASRMIGLGTHTLRAGDSVIEHPDLEHYGANLTDADVEILAATLYPEGAPLAIPVPTAEPSPGAAADAAAEVVPAESPAA